MRWIVDTSWCFLSHALHIAAKVRAGGIALLTVKDVKEDNSEEEAEEIYTDTRDVLAPQFASCLLPEHEQESRGPLG